ncbi:histidine kinase [Sinorhizobium terangae]|uniref:histidine kinase n=1 Tax=Sinorhizobium terangae TaxID=110322 RepID=UPI0024B06E77|nr:histidine kinase [Sinorhizobium terangae]WFU51309.1 histidine kinase [Sinorhizobium terangae]
MPEQKDLNADTSAPISAEQLRMQMLEREMAEMEKERKLRSLQEQKLADFAADFLEKHVTEQEIAVVRRLVQNAVKDGKFEAMVYSFPSSLCTDSGRAINSADRDWPQTLQGKAKEFYERYQTFGKPQGYKLKAMIINFPGGIPGDVGFFLDWSPDKV